MKKIRSRILEVFDKEILEEMYKLQSKRFIVGSFKGQRNHMEYSASMKVKDMTKLLTEYLTKKNKIFSFPGAGTNRMTVLIDGYIYKIALDQDGYIDNLNEFILSKEAQPYVTKTYESNGLLAVAEYVTLISYDEFVEKKSKILDILDDISREYLIGDMGWTQKNYTNWGYRKNSDDLVILDFGHMHRLSGEKLLCRECGSILQYNTHFTKLKCLACGKEEEFMTIKSRLSKKEERDNIDNALKRAYELTEPIKIIKEDEVKDMSVYEKFEEEEIVSTRFAQFKPKKTIREQLLSDNREVVDVSSVEELPEDVTEKIYENYMKVVQGKVKLKDKPIEVQEDKLILDPMIEEITDMEDREAKEYLFSLFISDKLTEDKYNYYIDYIENGGVVEEVSEPEESNAEVVIDQVNNNEDFYDEEAEKTYVFDDDDLNIPTNINPIDVMKNKVRSDEEVDTNCSFDEFMAEFKDKIGGIPEDDFEEDEFEEAELIDEPTEEEIHEIKLHSPSKNLIEKEKPVNEESNIGLKMVNATEEPEVKILSVEEVEKAKSAMGFDNTVGLRVKTVEDEIVSEVKQKCNEPEVKLTMVENKEEDKFNNEGIFLKMREIQQTRDEEEVDYSHYEDEYSHLMEDEEATRSRKNNWN